LLLEIIYFLSLFFLVLAMRLSDNFTYIHYSLISELLLLALGTSQILIFN